MLLLMIACQQKPTKITQTEPIMGEAFSLEQIRKYQPVILDARSTFDFNLAHVPGAINVHWEDFSQQDPGSRGLLQNDLTALARRLALIGISPDTKVLVLGKGKQGAGEEGRIAWTLQLLGVKDVFTMVHTSFRQQNPRDEADPVQNKSYWKPEIKDQLAIGSTEFKNKTFAEASDVVVIDVRSLQEYGLQNLKHDKKFKAVLKNIEWKEFFDDKGVPSKKILPMLAEQGITPNTTVLLVSNHGVRSAAATYALTVLGFKNARNFAGGLEQWKF
jgi:thiosulfate/3-mercaptopyruvate sulfurtransferase